MPKPASEKQKAVLRKFGLPLKGVSARDAHKAISAIAKNNWSPQLPDTVKRWRKDLLAGRRRRHKERKKRPAERHGPPAAPVLPHTNSMPPTDEQVEFLAICDLPADVTRGVAEAWIQEILKEGKEPRRCPTITAALKRRAAKGLPVSFANDKGRLIADVSRP